MGSANEVALFLDHRFLTARGEHTLISPRFKKIYYVFNRKQFWAPGTPPAMDRFAPSAGCVGLPLPSTWAASPSARLVAFRGKRENTRDSGIPPKERLLALVRWRGWCLVEAVGCAPAAPGQVVSAQHHPRQRRQPRAVASSYSTSPDRELVAATGSARGQVVAHAAAGLRLAGANERSLSHPAMACRGFWLFMGRCWAFPYGSSFLNNPASNGAVLLKPLNLR